MSQVGVFNLHKNVNKLYCGQHKPIGEEEEEEEEGEKQVSIYANSLFSPRRRRRRGCQRRPTRVNHISQAAFATIVVVVVPPYTISVHLTTLDHLRLRCHDKHLVIERSLYQQEIPRPPTVCAGGRRRRETTSACDILFVYAEMETVSRSYDYDGTMMLLMMMMMLWLLKDPK